MNWNAERCFYVAAVYLTMGARKNREIKARDVWCADCWATMGMWIKDNSETTHYERNQQWGEICSRPKGNKHKVIGSVTLLEV